MTNLSNDEIFKNYCKLIDTSVTTEHIKLIENSLEYQRYRLNLYFIEFLKTVKKEFNELRKIFT